MQVVHLLRKYNPDQWGGTETAIRNLCAGLRQHEVSSVVYCPRTQEKIAADPIANDGHAVKRFKACVPVWGLSAREKADLVGLGGNLFSFSLLGDLWREREASVIHSHTLGRLGGIALTVARTRKLPFVVTVHGGAMDLPASIKQSLNAPQPGWEWGKLFGVLLKARELFRQADAIITCNEKEAELLRQTHPGKRIMVQSHGVRTDLYKKDCREQALAAFPQIRNREVLLCLGRVDPVKNQNWVIDQMPEVLQRHPEAMLVLAGSCIDQKYGEAVRRNIEERGLGDRVLLAGGFPPADERLIGLFQNAKAMVLPSISETFGLVILEAWAAGTPVISSRTSGAMSLIKDGQNGWLYGLDQPRGFHQAVDAILNDPLQAKNSVTAGRELIAEKYDAHVLAGRMKNFYATLIEEKYAPRHNS